MRCIPMRFSSRGARYKLWQEEDAVVVVIKGISPEGVGGRKPCQYSRDGIQKRLTDGSRIHTNTHTTTTATEEEERDNKIWARDTRTLTQIKIQLTRQTRGRHSPVKKGGDIHM